MKISKLLLPNNLHRAHITLYPVNGRDIKWNCNFQAKLNVYNYVEQEVERCYSSVVLGISVCVYLTKSKTISVYSENLLNIGLYVCGTPSTEQLLENILCMACALHSQNFQNVGKFCFQSGQTVICYIQRMFAWIIRIPCLCMYVRIRTLIHHRYKDD